jgi:hypothetical protein
MHIEHPHETARLNEELARIQRCRVLAAWAEIKAERQARERMQMAPFVPQARDDCDE